MKKNNVKFNFVDVAIAVCLIVVVLAVSVYFVMSKQGAGSGTAQEFSYSILFREVTEEVANSIKKDAFIYDGNKNINIGKISDIEIKDCTKYEFDGVSG